MQALKNLPRMILVTIALVVVLIVVGIVVLVAGGGGGGDGGPGGATPPVLTPEDLKERLKGMKFKPAPRKRRGVVDEARRIGRLVQAQARGTVVDPGRIRVRVSAAPKQRVKVDWQLGCYLNRRAKIGRGKYTVRTPDVRQIQVSIPGAETCIATATAGLTNVDGIGRIKVAVIAG